MNGWSLKALGRLQQSEGVAQVGARLQWESTLELQAGLQASLQDGSGQTLAHAGARSIIARSQSGDGAADGLFRAGADLQVRFISQPLLPLAVGCEVTRQNV